MSFEVPRYKKLASSSNSNVTRDRKIIFAGNLKEIDILVFGPHMSLYNIRKHKLRFAKKTCAIHEKRILICLLLVCLVQISLKPLGIFNSTLM